MASAIFTPISPCDSSSLVGRRHKSAFQFIPQDPKQRASKELRKAVKSHVSGSKREKGRRPLHQSWILQSNGQLVAMEHQYESIPARVGSSMSGFPFPIELEPYMENSIAKALGPMRGTLYPSEICVQVDPAASSWTTNLLVDLVFLHCTIFSAESNLDSALGRSATPLTRFHLSQTLRLLQQRIDEPDKPTFMSDATIMVVLLLALTAEVHGDEAAANAHMQGLRSMVQMRGGLGALRFQNSRLPAKVCRVDLSIAIRFGQEPVFFRQGMPWDSFVHGESLVHGVSARSDTQDQDVVRFISTSDEKLLNILNDLHEFCRICNLAAQTSHKLLPNTFSEIMASVMYRLMGLSFASAPVLEALRFAMLVFASEIFLQWRGVRQRQLLLDGHFRQALLKIEAGSESKAVPLSLLFWVLTVYHVAAQRTSDTALARWLDDVMRRLRLSTWQEAKEVLKRTSWIGALFDRGLITVFHLHQAS